MIFLFPTVYKCYYYFFKRNKGFQIFFQNIIDNTKCRNPYGMTEDQLVNELTERGKDTKGSRKQLVERLVQSDKCNECILDYDKF